MADGPSCPRCGSPDGVATLTGPTRRGVYIEIPNGWQFHCSPCDLVFTGTEAEWARMLPVRLELRERLAKAAAFDEAHQ